MLMKIAETSTLLLLLAMALPVQVSAQLSLEKVLQESKIDYMKTDREGVLKIPSEIGDTQLIIYAYERTLFEDTEVKTVLVYFYTRLLSTPKNFKHPSGMLLTICQINDKLPTGRISVSDDGDILYNSSLYLEKADRSTLIIEFYLAALAKDWAAENLTPYVKE